MTRNITLGLMGLMASGSALAGDGLYSVGAQPEEFLPLEWIVGTHLVYDDNCQPGGATKDSSMAVDPYVAAKFTHITPQTILDFYAQLGMMYYFDAPSTMDDSSGQCRLSMDLFHKFSERLSLSSRNFVAYELEPNYAYGYAASRQSEEHLYWNLDESIDYSWTERFATRTGINLFGTHYQESQELSRVGWGVYNQFRYRLNPQSVLTTEYRYSTSQGDGVSSDSTDQYVLGGIEHRFSPTLIGRLSAGVQFRDVDDGDNSSSPYLEMSLVSRINSQFLINTFIRYGLESFDTVQTVGINTVEFDERKTLRIGVSSTYDISPRLQLFGGVDYIPSTFDGGRTVPLGLPVGQVDENVLNTYIGLGFQFTETLQGTCSYNYTNSDSDLAGRDYDRSRISVGVNAAF